MAEVVTVLAGKSVVVDATLGAGGHAEALLDGGVGSVLGIDRDPSATELARRRLARFGARFRAVTARFSDLSEALAGMPPVGGVLFDLGVSSMHLDDPVRGFSYRAEGPLDMRMGGDDGPTAAGVVNTYREEDLARVIFEYGEERYSRRIAGAIVRARNRAPLTTTTELAAVVASAVPRGRRGGPHPARRTFQALRIEVNGELDELAASLPQAASSLEEGGRLAVIAYHSLEDRVVKRFVVGEPSLARVTRTPIRPTEEEVRTNPRARSARLRVAERIAEEAA